ncbi:hypothetical protein HYFRA_00001700 [Hymenoscyphus fraxineus]|uniref:Uncharacterized protein n=1 Tax=Hymenoscyphus fraxineus TaxID=746836 RepID=A0A9N9L941_9HELO|nr:hypothetical protein HYFRA_00001700 [Hymenoscyphus fraxineus]
MTVFQKIHEIEVQDSRGSERATREVKDRDGKGGGRRRRVERDRSIGSDTKSARERSSSTSSWSSRSDSSMSDDAFTSSDSDDSDYMPQEFSFKLSRYRAGLPSRESAASPAVGKGTRMKEPLTSSQQPLNKANLGNVTHVLKSQYTGDGSIDGDQSVELKVAENISSQNQPLFKWLQVEDANMNFDRFETAAKALPDLTDSQRSGINTLFKRVRKDYVFGELDRPMHTSNGASVRFMAPIVLSTTIRPKLQDLNESSRQERSVAWMCLPYFLIQKYSSNSKDFLPASHPAKTLLQSQSSFAHEKRDMQQTVCKLPGCPQGHCFHIAQVWCLVVDDSFLITGSQTSISTLMGKHVSLSTELPPPNMVRSQSQTRYFASYPTQIQVSRGDDLWSFPVDECKTWFKFLLHFWEFSPKKLQFSYAGDIIQSKSWPQIIQQAAKINIKLSMTEVKAKSIESGNGLIYSQGSASKGDTPSTRNHATNSQIAFASSETNGLLGTPPNLTKISEKDTTETSHSRDEDESLKNSFHVFTWLSEPQPGSQMTQNGNSLFAAVKGSPVVEKRLRKDLEEVDRYLISQPSFKDRTAYMQCGQLSRDGIYEMLAKERESIPETGNVKRIAYERKVVLINKAETIFRFFIPFQLQGRTIGKFWGAIGQILGPLPTSGRTSLPLYWPIVEWLDELIESVQFVTEVFSQAEFAERSNIDLPEELANAWIPFLMSFMHCRSRTSEIKFEIHSAHCHYLVKEGINHLFLDLGQKRLLNYRVIKPLDLASIANLALLGDITGQMPTIEDSYSQYLGHLDKLRAFQQEISVIRDTLLQQRRNLDCYQQISSSSLYSTELGSVEPLLLALEGKSRQKKHSLSKTKRFEALRPAQGYTQYFRNRRSKTYLPRGPVGPPPPPGPRVGPPPPPGPRVGPPPPPGNTGRSVYGAGAESSVMSPRPGFPRHETLGVNQHNATYSSQNPPTGFDKYKQVHRPSGINGVFAPVANSGQYIDPREPNHLRDLLLQESYNLLDLKIQQFRDMSSLARELEAYNMAKISHNKDRQEAAIFIFTIVTVIFLPLSTVAGILGMNTNDVRNMEIDQWVFWVTAIPLTIIVIILCLLWTGELWNVGRWFSNVGRGGNTQESVHREKIGRVVIPRR